MLWESELKWSIERPRTRTPSRHPPTAPLKWLPQGWHTPPQPRPPGKAASTDWLESSQPSLRALLTRHFQMRSSTFLSSDPSEQRSLSSFPLHLSRVYMKQRGKEAVNGERAQGGSCVDGLEEGKGRDDITVL